jgi:hypothetical protein
VSRRRWRRRVPVVASTLAHRLRRDYLRPARLEEFRRLLRCSLQLGYETMTLAAFADLAAAGEVPARGPILLIRHDIDSDVSRARRMWEIERELGVLGSYFFRRSTWDVSLLRELASTGFEVGYHYEELATLVKERGAATADAARALIVPARERLRTSLAELRAETGLALDVLASHGDFANSAVGVSNVELLADWAFREEIGVRVEAYDVEDHVDARSTDAADRGVWWPHDPVEALRRGEHVVQVLVHPRAWGAAPVENVRQDLHRLREGIAYRLRCGRSTGRAALRAGRASSDDRRSDRG